MNMALSPDARNIALRQTLCGGVLALQFVNTIHAFSASVPARYRVSFRLIQNLNYKELHNTIVHQGDL